MADRDFSQIAADYTRDVLDGRRLACQQVKAACRRQVADLERADFGYVYDPSRGARVCRFIELLPHIKGSWAGQMIRLEPWQIWVVMTVFSWVGAPDSDRPGLRRFRTVYVEVPRKNAKSTLTSGIGLYMLALDDEGGAECYSAATTRDQAKIVWNDARQMALRSPGFRNRFGVGVAAHAITVDQSASRFVALSSEDGTLDGLNTHFVSLDELHAHKTRGLYDVMETSTGARTQSLLWLITTAGSNRAGICYETRERVSRILAGTIHDETVFGVIYTVDEGDDPFSPETWAKANPNYGVSVLPDDIARLAAKAKDTPSALNTFLTKRLDVWVNADTAWMAAGAWDKCKDATLSLDQFANEPVWMGADLANRDDLASIGLVFSREIEGKRHFYVFARNYLCEHAVESSQNSQYSGWVRDGRIIEAGETSTDFGRIKDDLRADVRRFEMRVVAFDPFQARQITAELVDEGLPAIVIGMTVKELSEPMKDFAAAVADGRMHHDGCPVLAWAVSNVVCHVDAKENVYPRKAIPQNKIDPFVAVLLGFNRALLEPQPDTSSWLVGAF